MDISHTWRDMRWIDLLAEMVFRACVTILAERDMCLATTGLKLRRCCRLAILEDEPESMGYRAADRQRTSGW